MKNEFYGKGAAVQSLPEQQAKMWTTEKVETYTKLQKLGLERGPSPFFNKNPMKRLGNVVFEWTAEEIEEWKKCSEDVLYFAKKYCYAMTDEGIQNITLRDYQEDALRQYQENRNNIVLAGRQCGKCQNFDTKITVNDNILTVYELWFSMLEKPTIIQRIKYLTYKLLNKLENYYAKNRRKSSKNSSTDN
jgi:hypothetical protein